jgi:Fe-S cluster biogenesis protein NfuA
VSWSDQRAREHVGRLDRQLQALDRLPAPARESALSAISATVEMYGQALARILQHAPEDLAQRFCEDELLRHLLIVHGLHPRGTEQRVRQALAELAPYLRQHGGGVELVAIEEGTARLRLQGACDGCPSSAQTLRLTVEEAVLCAAPELDRVAADGAVDKGPQSLGEPQPLGAALPLVQTRPQPPGPCPAGSLGAAP